MFQMFPNQENVHEKMMKLLNVQLSLTNLGMENTEIDRLEPTVAVVPLSACIKEEMVEIVDATTTCSAVSPNKDNSEEKQSPSKAKIEIETYPSSADQTVAIDYENVKKDANRKSDQHKKELKKTQFKCDLCEFTSFTRISMKKHQLTHKTKIIYECNDCSKSFNDFEKLSTHKKEHGKEMPYFCSRCKHGFFHKDNKDQHEKSCKSNGHYNCKQCDFTSNSKIGLMSHERTHSYHFCDHCNKNFTSSWNLHQHKKCILRRSAA